MIGKSKWSPFTGHEMSGFLFMKESGQIWRS